MPFKVVPALYAVWQGMKRRCGSPTHTFFPAYGARGIKVCERWARSYAAFAEDMGPRPPGTTLDRINNEGHYEPGNCRWATKREQQRNQRVTRRVAIEGAQVAAVELAERAGLKTDTIVARAAQGVTGDALVDSGRRVYTPGLALGGRANGERQRARTHCMNGHEFTAANTNVTPQGWRRCRACNREKQARLMARKRAKTHG